MEVEDENLSAKVWKGRKKAEERLTIPASIIIITIPAEEFSQIG